MAAAANNNNSSSSISKIPWEPYKGATDKQTARSLNNEPKSLNLDKENLIKYELDTDLNEFNSHRPGYQFDTVDLNFIKKADGTSESAAFLDARFYTDAYFLKLASQLKKDSSSNNASRTAAAAAAVTSHSTTNNNNNKPINVVGPLIEDKTPSSSARKSDSKASKIESNSMKYWRSQKEQYEKKIEYLESQMSGVYEQLNIQTQVNMELKKMLIASVGGEDMQYKLERLINDKFRYEYELSNNGKTIEKMAEQIEQISIQCDLWRSKFLAAKLMSEEYLTW
jgi:hypothetical protein